MALRASVELYETCENSVGMTFYRRSLRSPSRYSHARLQIVAPDSDNRDNAPATCITLISLNFIEDRERYVRGNVN